MIHYRILLVFMPTLLLLKDVGFESAPQPTKKELFSSVWCGVAHFGMRNCIFNNIFYSTRFGFTFVLSESSLISGLSNYQELQSLRVSPIENHPAADVRFNILEASHVSLRELTYLDEQYFLMSRFKPDNFLHVIHDDIIPLFARYNELCMGQVGICASKYRLLLADPHDDGPFIQWYRAMSSSKPLSSQNLPPNRLYCFSSVLTGVSNTTFFQYGFKKPQGPVNTTLHADVIKYFRKFVIEYFKIDVLVPKFPVITLINRSVNRKIMNMNYVVTVISTLIEEKFINRKELIEVNSIDMLSNSTESILLAVARSHILLGMHGAESILSLFLPDASVFIEVFPFGILRENVSPMYSLSLVKNLHFTYLSWHNVNEENSVVHPEYPQLFGGTDSFTQPQRNRIHHTKTIPPVECCQNPYYLFRMYQDTFVDESFQKVASEAVNSIFNETHTIDVISKWLFPGPVQSLECGITYENRSLIKFWSSWNQPVNIFNRSIKYYVIVAALGSNIYTFTEKKSIEMKFDYQPSTVIQVWISVLMDLKESEISYCEKETM